MLSFWISEPHYAIKRYAHEEKHVVWRKFLFTVMPENSNYLSVEAGAYFEIDTYSRESLFPCLDFLGKSHV